MAKNPARGNPNQEGTSVPAEMMECERKPRIIIRKPRIIVQGGMYTDLECGGAQLQEEFMDALKGAARNGYDVLRDNGTAVDAVEKAILGLEENGRFNAGRGSYKTDRGDVECDAMIMDGHKVDAGAVTAASFILHPVSLARKVMDESDHCTLCADGALEFAMKKNFPVEFVEGRDYPWDGPNRLNDIPGDTVTAIAMDCKGNLACAASSGGIPGKSKGRVGDVPLVGCGGYANEYGAAAACGHGESIIRMTVAKEVVSNMQKLNQSAQEAADTALQEVNLKLNEPYVAVTAISREGSFGMAAINASAMPWASISDRDHDHVIVLRSGTQPGVIHDEVEIE